MKYTKILLALTICFVLGCSNPDVIIKDSVDGVGSGGGSYSSISTQTVTLSMMQSGTANILSAIRASPSSYLVTENGLTYIRFQNTTGSAAFNYTNGLRVIYSTEFPDLTWDQARAEAVYLMSNMQSQTTWTFRGNLLSTFDYVRNNIDGLTFSQYESYMENKLSSIVNQPTIIGVPKLTANEQFALTQAYYVLLNQARWAVQNPSASATSGCLPSTTEEWKDITKKALVAGLLGGLKMGWDGIVAGMIATGGHPVGGIVGGLTGFTLGFAGGAIATGGVYLLAGCIVNKIFSMKRAFYCYGKTYYAYSVAPPSGCTTLQGSVDLKSILDFGLVPNKGKTALAITVVNDINWLLSYL
jgi:hypothetical protein